MKNRSADKTADLKKSRFQNGQKYKLDIHNRPLALSASAACFTLAFLSANAAHALPGCGDGSDLTIANECLNGVAWTGGSFTVDASGSIESTTPSVLITDPAEGTTFTNNGSISSSDASHGAVYVDGASLEDLLNNDGATISSANQSAIDNSFGMITNIINGGTLSASRYGILNEQGTIGSIHNTETGSIVGTEDRAQGITNNGTLTSIINDGLINSTDATPNSYPDSPEPSPTGIINNKSVESITNNGTIMAGGSANGSGIVNSAQSVTDTWATIGTLTNTGLITVDSYAPGNTANPPYTVAIENTYGYIDQIDNQGELVATGFEGAAAYGVENYGTVTEILNSGSITATSDTGSAYGLFNRGKGSVRPTATINSLTNIGEISSSTYGIYNLGTMTMIDNSGEISGDEIGIYSTGAHASIQHIANSGTITGGTVAIDASGEAGPLTITNSGTISAPTSLRIGANTVELVAESGSVLAGDIIIDGGALTVSVADNFTFASAITGTGSLIKAADGTLILTGANSFTGGTTISAGTLQIGDGRTSGSLEGNIVNNAALVFNRADEYDFPGTISGTGSVTILGGTVNFIQTDAYSGPISLQNTDFILNAGAVSASSINIGAGGVIGGSGTIGSLAVQSGGAVSPGYSPGTLIVTGDVTFDDGSVYRVDVMPDGAHDQINAGGTASITGGTVEVVGIAANYIPGTAYTILTAAGGVYGRFSTLSANYAFLDPTLSYESNAVILTLMRNKALFADAALTPNQKTTATAAETLGDDNSAYSAVVKLTKTQTPAAFDALSGELHGSIKGALLDDSRFLREAALQRIRTAFGAISATPSPVLAYASNGSGKTVSASANTRSPAYWLSAYGAWSDIDSNGNSAAMDHDIAGFTTGLDAELTDTIRSGLYVGYGRSTYQLDARNSSGESTNYSFGLYAGRQLGQIGIRVGAAYTHSVIDTSRTATFTGFSDAMSAEYSAETKQIFAEAGYRIDIDAGSIEPFAGLAYINLDTDEFSETGGDAALLSTGSATDYGVSTLGIRAAKNFVLGGFEHRATGSVGWRHAFGSSMPGASLSFGDMAAFEIEGLPIASEAAFVEAGIAAAISENAELGISYSGQFSDNAHSQGVHGNLSVKF